jgi:hypothetical protein
MRYIKTGASGWFELGLEFVRLLEKRGGDPVCCPGPAARDCVASDLAAKSRLLVTRPT